MKQKTPSSPHSGREGSSLLQILSHWGAGALIAVNLGNDADTTGAIYGQLAGAYYGEDGIPEEWRSKLAMRDLIGKFAERVYELKQTISI